MTNKPQVKFKEVGLSLSWSWSWCDEPAGCHWACSLQAGLIWLSRQSRQIFLRATEAMGGKEIVMISALVRVSSGFTHRAPQEGRKSGLHGSHPLRAQGKAALASQSLRSKSQCDQPNHRPYTQQKRPALPIPQDGKLRLESKKEP